ncbi:MAG TPA: response regulator [Candidatus Omnitrophota bacterium]|nr:response regulator [Candidatus Omnitrophota bacterium]
MEKPSKKKVLVIEDNEDIADILFKRLELAGYLPELVKNGIEAISKLLKNEFGPQAVILDLMLPGRMGYDLLNTIKSTWPDTKVFVFSAHKEYRGRIPTESISGFFCKTDGIDQLITAVQTAVEK